jgi:hypothetical protein
MVTMGIFPFKEKSPWQNRESNPEPHDQQSETPTTRPWGWSVDDIYDMIYLFTGVRLTPSGSSTVHIHTQMVHRITH